MSEPNANVSRFKRFVSVSLKNESINLHKKRMRQKQKEVSYEETICDEIETEDAFDFLENKVRVVNFDMVVKNDLLYEVLSSWQQKHRDLIYLSFCERWSDIKIGIQLNMSRSAVQRLKKKLHEELRSKLSGGKNENT